VRSTKKEGGGKIIKETHIRNLPVLLHHHQCFLFRN
jgi:hypothetical protein